jgi:hypothetical protein
MLRKLGPPGGFTLPRFRCASVPSSLCFHPSAQQKSPRRWQQAAPVSHGSFPQKSALTPPTARSRWNFVISKAIPALLPELARMRKRCSGAVQPARRRSPQESSTWNQWLQAPLPYKHSPANVRHSAIDSAPSLSAAQGVCLPVLTIAYALPSESCARARARSPATLTRRRNISKAVLYGHTDDGLSLSRID